MEKLVVSYPLFLLLLLPPCPPPLSFEDPSPALPHQSPRILVPPRPAFPSFPHPIPLPPTPPTPLAHPPLQRPSPPPLPSSRPGLPVLRECSNEFRQELRILQSLRHPNIVQFLGAVTKSRPRMIVTEHRKVPNFYMTDAISRASVTMAKCTSAKAKQAAQPLH
ncbi:unnamed protein product [Closterium sp. Naga37s-1]|nr:unnamed protein product [Closterium sp. Naga37s-1]CAI5492474.1 unnamed protein product [Closterium sp. Naga37s-1]